MEEERNKSWESPRAELSRQREKQALQVQRPWGRSVLDVFKGQQGGLCWGGNDQGSWGK